MENIHQSTPAKRIPLQVNVEYRKSYARHFELGTLKNISVSGAFLSGPEAARCQKRDKVCLVVRVGGRTRKLHATIVWTNALGAGLKFHHYNNRDFQIVDDLIYFVEKTRKSRRNVLETIFKKVA